jgi:hypothetical protein
MQTAPRKVKTGNNKHQPRPWASARSKQARAHIVAQRKARRTTPGLRDLLAQWDAAQDAARAHLTAHNEAYRESFLVPDRPDDAEPSPAWQTLIDGLAPTEA